MPGCYEYPYSNNSLNHSVSEHHYDVPHLAIQSGQEMSPSTSSCSRTIESANSGTGKKKHDLESVSSGFTSCKYQNYSVFSPIVPPLVLHTSLPRMLDVKISQSLPVVWILASNSLARSKQIFIFDKRFGI